LNAFACGDGSDIETFRETVQSIFPLLRSLLEKFTKKIMPPRSVKVESKSGYVVQTGPRGGKYYVNDDAKKVYVSRATKSKSVSPKQERKSLRPVKGSLLGTKTVVGATHVAAWSPVRNREYERIKQSELNRGRSEKDATRIAAATVNKIRSMHGETREYR
jgi:hypothetical protein